MKTKLCVVIFLLAATLAPAQTNNLTALLQQGLFEEQANRNLDAAIEDYAALARQFDKHRQLAATAVFRLGECYRAQGKTNEAAVQYQRILHDFSDQQTLATLSQQNLAGIAGDSSRGTVSLLTEPLSKASEATSELEKELALLKARVELATRETNRTLLVEFIGDKKLQQDLEVYETVRSRLESAKSGAKSEWSVSELEASLKLCEDNFKAAFNHWLSNQEFQRRYLESAISQLPKNATDNARQQQKELLTKQIALAEQDLAETQKLVELGKATAAESRTAEREVLRLRQQLAALNVGKAGPLDLATTSTSEEDQEIARIKKIVQNSPDLINAPMSGANNQTPLVNAAQKGWMRVVQYLLDNGAQVDNAALFAATAAGHKAMVELLLERGADVNARDGEKATPLHRAAENGFLSVAEVLIQYKADLEARTKEYTSTGLGRHETSWKSGQTPLQQAVNAKRPAMVDLLLNKGAAVNTTNDNGRTSLFLAAINNDLPALNQLIKAGAKLDIVDKDGATALRLAIERENPDCVKTLLAAKANPNAGKENSTLLSAIKSPETLKALLAAGAKLGTNESFVFNAISKPESLKLLLAAGINPKTKGALVSAIYGGQEESAALLVQYGADVNAPGINNMTPLMMAVWTQNLPILSMLLTNKVDINAWHPARRTALMMSKEAEEGYRPSTPGAFGGSSSLPEKNLARSISDLLRQHGALDKMPEWDRIVATRPNWNYSLPIFSRNTNDWNRFSLLEMLYFCKWSKGKDLQFPDLANILIVRPATNSMEFHRMTVNLLNTTNGLDCSRDVQLEFGDIVEIPEREHSLAEKETYLTAEQERTILAHFQSQKNEAKLVVGNGTPTALPLQPFASVIGEILSRAPALNVLTSISDLSRVKVTRQNPKTKKPETWVLDCRNINTESQPWFWLRNGDTIEVPQK